MSTQRHESKIGTAALLGAIALGITAAYTALPTIDGPPATLTTTTSAPMARAQLAALTVQVEDTGAHYNRDEWGNWTTTRGCTTRETVLRRDGHNVRTTGDCRVTAGQWASTYDNATLTSPTAVQIDHRVPVKEANRSGARTWTRQQRERFYNDPANLVAVSGRSNTSKGDRDPGTWRPPARDSWCGYATAYIATKATYRLTVDDRERDGLISMLNTCATAGGAR